MPRTVPASERATHARLLAPFDASRRADLRRRLLRWHARHGRSLPWRDVRDPYRVWISEIMLQQTTVKAVIPYYERFLGRFPNVRELAAASEEQVLQLWEGLGYYSRGRNLHRAARVIVERHGGEFPRELEELQSLPGVGRYTAGAIRSFAFDLPAPIVEANTQRLYARLLGYPDDPRDRAGQQLLWEFAERLQPRSAAGRLNQALMDLGAVVCTPVQPQCPECPLRPVCVVAETGAQDDIPHLPRRVNTTQVVEATVAVRRGERYLVQQRGAGERWENMWDFPRFPITSVAFADDLAPRAVRAVAAEVCAAWSKANARLNVPLFAGLQVHGEMKHTVTRYRIRLLCLVAEADGTPNKRNNDAQDAIGDNGKTRWLTLDELAQLPMPVTGRKFAKLLQQE